MSIHLGYRCCKVAIEKTAAVPMLNSLQALFKTWRSQNPQLGRISHPGFLRKRKPRKFNLII